MTSALALEFMTQHLAKSEPHRGVEQLVARRAHNPKVVGSSPTPATTKEQSEMVALFFSSPFKVSAYWHLQPSHCLLRLTKKNIFSAEWLVI